ncbi:hypothetical protein RRG08_019408 [Elysia crispata]|uniref:Uncharacterized protein n=1 Tax=Elysia crispata TaxID=231223 RepID=A0AAE0YLC5_9GAST|nr:hypothetical protein RRG08_019408 [Elysia crispata]
MASDTCSCTGVPRWLRTSLLIAAAGQHNLHVRDLIRQRMTEYGTELLGRQSGFPTPMSTDNGNSRRTLGRQAQLTLTEANETNF